MILLTGASASGKTEVARFLRKKYGIVKAITHTSRSPRVGEKDGVDYFFVTPEAFNQLLAADKMVEHACYNGAFYGCSKAQVRDDKCVVLEPNGLRSFLALNDASVVSFLLTAEESTREKRMHERGDEEANIERRLKGDRIDFAPDKIAPTDFVIATDNKTIEEIADDIYVKYVLTLKSRGLNPVFPIH